MERFGLLTSAETSRQLGVSMRQVQRLAASGALSHSDTVGGTHLIDARSVQLRKVRGAARGRPWEAETIAAAIELLTCGDTTRLTPVARGRLYRRLSGMSAEQFVRATRKRAEVRRFRASKSFVGHLQEAINLTGVAAVGRDPALGRVFGLAGGDRLVVDGYVNEKTARRLIRECRMVADPSGSVTLRVTNIDLLLDAHEVVVALDLADSLEVRSRSAGLAHLTQRLRVLR